MRLRASQPVRRQEHRADVGARGQLLTIWGALLLYYVGVLPEIAASLEEAKLPVGKISVSLLDLGRDGDRRHPGGGAVAFGFRSLIEQRLMRMSAPRQQRPGGDGEAVPRPR